MKPFITSFFLLLISFAVHPTASAQKTKDDKEAQVKEIVLSQEYIFTVQSVQTMRGTVSPALNLTGYDCTVSKDSIISYLPHFGRAYAAPKDPTEGGLKFTSTEFDYSIENAKKGGWDVQIVTKDIDDAQHIFLTISKDGYATLQVVTANRQPITFMGRVGKRRL